MKTSKITNPNQPKQKSKLIMPKSLNHLPKNKQDELAKIVSAIQKTSDDVEIIILFGSYARGDYKEKKDLKPKAKSGHISDYDILVVTSIKKSTDQFVGQSSAEKLKLSAQVRIISHDIQALNICLAEGQYLFTDIKKEGIVLYDSGKYKLANKRRLKPEEKQRIAGDYFDHWFDKANDFWDKYQLMFKNNKPTSAAFDLHQVAESCYKTMLLVFTNYNPQEHYLGLLKIMTSKHHPDLKKLFPRKSKKQRDLFDLLEYAYIGGRYDSDYKISKEDLEILAVDVKKLLKLTEEVCREKIESFV